MPSTTLFVPTVASRSSAVRRAYRLSLQRRDLCSIRFVQIVPAMRRFCVAFGLIFCVQLVSGYKGMKMGVKNPDCDDGEVRKFDHKRSQRAIAIVL